MFGPQLSAPAFKFLSFYLGRRKRAFSSRPRCLCTEERWQVYPLALRIRVWALMPLGRHSVVSGPE
jgi:hypothetical protein